MPSPRVWILPLALAAALSACGGDDPAQLLSSAREAYAAGDYQSASVDLRNILKEEPEHAQARLLLGETTLVQGDPATAESQLRRALDLGVDPEQVMPALARALLGQGKYRELLDDFEADADLSPAVTAAVHAAHGRAALELGEMALARASLEAALNADRASLEGLVARALFRIRSGDPDAAREDVEAAAAAAGDHGQVALARAELAFREQQLDVAAENFRAVSAAPGTQVLPIERFDARLKLAETLLRQDRLDEAEELVAQLRSRAERHPAVNYLAGVIEFQRGRLDDAVARLQMALSGAPDSLQTKSLLGAVRMQQGQFVQAESHLSDVVSAQPDNLQARLMLVQVLRETGSTARATRLLGEGVRHAQGDREAMGLIAGAAADLDATDAVIASLGADDGAGRALRTSLGQVLIERGRDEDALSILSGTSGASEAEEVQRRRLMVMAALRSDTPERAVDEAEALVADRPDDPDAHNLAGGVYLALERFDEARERFRRARELAPDDAAADLNLGLVALAQGDAEQAVASLGRGLEKNPDNADAMLAMARAEDARGERGAALEWLERARETSARAVEPRVLLARYYLGQGDTARGRELASEAVIGAPRRPDILGLRGLAELADGDADSAVTSLAAAVDMAPTVPNLRFALARAQLAAERPADAVRTLQRLRARSPEFLQGVYTLGIAHYEAGDPDAALETVDALTGSAQGDALAAMLEGELRWRMDEAASAYDAFARAADLGIRDALQRAVAAGRAAGVDDPVAPLERWLADRPDDDQVRLQLANYHAAEGQFAASIPHYEALLDSGRESDPTVLNNLAWAYHEQGDERAMATARRAYQAAPESPAILDTLGWIETLAGNTVRGVELLGAAVERAPDAGEIRYHYAEALARQGNDAAALEQVNRALEAGAFTGRDRAERLRERLQ